MSSVSRNDGEGTSSYHLQVPNGRSMSNGQARALTRLATAGKNDSVKSTYSLSVFLDPDASKDMVRHEELWYPMDDPGNQGLDGINLQGQRTAALSAAAAGSRNLEDRLMLTQEQSAFVSNQATNYQGQNEGLMRNGSRSSTSSSVAARSAHRDHRSGNESGSDMESHFNRNTVVLGVQPGEGGRRGGGESVERRGREMERGGGGRESGGENEGERGVGTEVRAGAGTAEELAHGGVRRWSTEGNLQRASEGHDTDDDEYGEEEVEQEEVLQVRSQITGALSKASPPHGRGVSASSDSAADDDEEEALGYSTRTAERSGLHHVHNTSGSATDENGDGYKNSDTTRARQTLKTSDSSTEEEDEVDGGAYHMETQERKSFGERMRGASSGSASAADDDDEAGAKYSSTMQPRTSFGGSRSRAEPTSFTDYGRSSNAVNYDGSMKRTVQGRDAAADEEDLTLTEGSDDEEQTGNSSYNRQQIHGRPKLSRTMQVDSGGGGSRGIDSHGYQNGVPEVRSSAPRNSSAAVHSEGELSRDYQQRRYESGPGRQGIRRAPATQSEGETGGRVGMPPSYSSQPYRGRSDIGRRSQEGSSDDDANNWNASGGGTLNRRNDSNASTYNNDGSTYNNDGSTYNDGRRTEDGSHSEGEQEGLRQDERQPTPVIRVTTPSSSSGTGPRRASQQFTSDEDVARIRSNPPPPGSSTYRGRKSASNGVRNAPTASQSLTSEEEETSFQRNRQDLVSNATRPRDVTGGQYQPHPAERKKFAAADSMSSNGYSSPREPYPANNYFPRAANARGGGGRGSSDTDSVSASDYHQHHRTNGVAPTRRVYRDHRGQSTDGQPRSGAPPSDRYNGSSHQSNHNRPSANHTTSYSDESDVDDYNGSRSHQQFVLDFPSEAEDLGGTGRSTRKTTTVKKTTTTPVTGVVRVTPEPKSSSGDVVRKTATKTVKTTPVIGIVSIPDADPIQRRTPALPPQRNRTPVVGLISVSRSPSPERAKTPVVGLITVPPPPSMHSQSMTTTTRTHQPVSGMISVSSSSNQMLRGRSSITPSAQLHPDVNNNINAYPGKFRSGLASSGSFIETLAVPIETDISQAEIVGVDPELRRAQKTGSNQYRITMNLRPVVSDSSEVGYEVYDTAFGRATPIAMDRLRMNGSTTAASDWRYLEGGADESYFRPSSVIPTGTLRSRQSNIRAPNSQRGFVTRRSGHEGSVISKANSVAYSQGRIASPASRQIYNIPRGSSVGTIDGSRSLSRQGPQYLRDSLIQVPTIRQTVTSRPLRQQSSDAELYGYNNQGYLGGGGRSRQNSAMSSVFMSPTMERRYNVSATNGPSSFRDDSFSYRGGRFN